MISLIADGVNIICFAFNKLNVFKFEAEINSIFLRLRVANFNAIVFFETITKSFWSKFTEQFWQIFKKFFVFGSVNSVSKFSIIKILFFLLQGKEQQLIREIWYDKGLDRY